ncbi:MAG TPA: (d)CMP kinase [Sedimentisphaerales bacterium]|nr:(d)CMP kinase [Sedimentisphaerales bacterium]
MANLIITIDGPAASGKSTAARLLAAKLGASFLDTGAMYRAVTLAAMQAGVDLADQAKLLGVLQNSRFEFEVQNDKTVVRLDGVDVTEQIRSPLVTANARHIASAPRVRARLVEMQRRFAASREKVVTEGRDQGTAAFPDAGIKFFLTAELTERARRRYAELAGEQDLDHVRRAVEERDKSDESRGVGPLRPADDAIVVDTTNLTIEQVVEKLLDCVKQKCLPKE